MGEPKITTEDQSEVRYVSGLLRAYARKGIVATNN
jgi:hypothetical protein